eukprot:565859-Pleurochrysis_carterae.AAC.2
MPLRSMRWRWEGVCAIRAFLTATGTGAAATLGPLVYSPTRNDVKPLIEQARPSHRCATFRADERGYAAERSAPSTVKPSACANTSGWHKTATRHSIRPFAESAAKRVCGVCANPSALTPSTASPVVGGGGGRLPGRTPESAVPSPAPRNDWRACASASGGCPLGEA